MWARSIGWCMLGEMIRKAGEVLFSGFYLVVAGVLVLCFVFGLPFLWYGRGK